MRMKPSTQLRALRELMASCRDGGDFVIPAVTFDLVLVHLDGIAAEIEDLERALDGPAADAADAGSVVVPFPGRRRRRKPSTPGGPSCA